MRLDQCGNRPRNTAQGRMHAGNEGEMMHRYAVTIVMLAGTAVGAAEEDTGDWSFEARAFVNVASADRIQPEPSLTAFLEGAPIYFWVGFGIPRVPESSPRGPSDIYSFYHRGPMAVDVVPQDGSEPFEAELVYLAPLTYVYVPSQSKRWFSATWGFMDERMKAGRYVLIFKPSRFILKISKFEPDDKLEIVISPPRDEIEEYSLAQQKAAFYLLARRFDMAETVLLDLERRFPGYVELPLGLAACYEAVNGERPFEYFKEHVRRFAAGRPMNPKHAKMLDGKNPWELPYHYRPQMSGNQKRRFARAAVRAGAAATEAEGRAILERMIEDGKAGKDTGSLPRAYLTPMLSSAARAKGGGGKALVIGVAAAGLVLLGVGAFLLVRRARRSGG